MTDKEFKRLSRAQLIEVIYQLQMKQAELSEENQQLKEELEDKRLRIAQAGNIAEAALEVNHVMEAAQEAAAQYLEEIRILRAETEAERLQILTQAREEAEQTIAMAKKTHAALSKKLQALHGGRGSGGGGAG